MLCKLSLKYWMNVSSTLSHNLRPSELLWPLRWGAGTVTWNRRAAARTVHPGNKRAHLTAAVCLVQDCSPYGSKARSNCQHQGLTPVTSGLGVLPPRTPGAVWVHPLCACRLPAGQRSVCPHAGTWLCKTDRVLGMTSVLFSCLSEFRKKAPMLFNSSTVH